MNASTFQYETPERAAKTAAPEVLGAPEGAIKLIIIHEDFSSAERAKHFAEQFAESIGCSCDISDTIWRSDSFDDDEVAGDVTCAAADADYVIVSLLGERVLPIAARNWIEAWLEGSRLFATGLIVLAETGRCHFRVVEGTCRYLRGVCSLNGVSFSTCFTANPSDGSVDNFCIEEEIAASHEPLEQSRMPLPLKP